MKKSEVFPDYGHMVCATVDGKKRAKAIMTDKFFLCGVCRSGVIIPVVGDICPYCKARVVELVTKSGEKVDRM